MKAGFNEVLAVRVSLPVLAVPVSGTWAVSPNAIALLWSWQTLDRPSVLLYNQRYIGRDDVISPVSSRPSPPSVPFQHLSFVVSSFALVRLSSLG